MRVTCLQETLQHALDQVTRAVATRTSLPALSNVLLVTDNGRLKIVASDLNIAITTWIGASIEEEGRLAVDARLLTDFVHTLPSGRVELTSSGPQTLMTVTCGRDRAEINGIDAEDFPEIPVVVDDVESTSIDPAALREMISQVEFAAASDESRPVLAGVLMRIEGDRIVLAAADGFRLAVREGRMNRALLSPIDIIVPARSTRELARLLGEAKSEVALYVTPNRSQLIVHFSGENGEGEVEFLSRLIDGTFPDYRQIIPNDFSTRVEMERDALLTAVRRSSYFARDNNDAIRFDVQTTDDGLDPGTIEVSANAAERGNSHSYVDAAISGPPMQIAFNARYLNDVLGVIKTGSASLGLNGSNQAGVIRSGDSDDYTHVIMPMVIGAQ
ncbi:MAG: DNA polymerase III subunit beta [Thermomicrobiales bacterium]|nr:DNA polymerase III subunit beta [Thermomicrobiales bacterium]